MLISTSFAVNMVGQQEHGLVSAFVDVWLQTMMLIKRINYDSDPMLFVG